MNITYVKWNTEKPKFEEVKDKWIFMEWETKQTGLQTDLLVSYTAKDHESNFEGMIRYAVLSDEQPVCEWERIAEGEHKNYFRSQCQRDLQELGGGNRIWLPVQAQEPFCGHCGRLIHIVDELKPLPLMGIEPVLIHSSIDNRYWYEISYNGFDITSQAKESNREAIESWNYLKKRLTGEK
jgi:hypothetical protein